jgi:Helix-turn-helix domain
MTLRAIMWALKDAKVGDPTAKLVLIGLADHAHDDGTAAWPSHATLAVYAEVSERTVIRKLQYLESVGLIKPGDQTLLADVRADRRPRIWDLNMTPRGVRTSPRDTSDGVTERHPVKVHGVTSVQPRGDIAVSPEPKEEPKEITTSLRSVVTRATRLESDWIPDAELIAEMRAECPTIDLQAEHRKFVDFWCSKSGKDATKLDWRRTWRNWIRNAKPVNGQNRYALKRQEETDQHFQQMLDRARQLDRQDQAQGEIEQ